MFFVENDNYEMCKCVKCKSVFLGTPLIIRHLKNLLNSLQNRRIFLLARGEIFYTFAEPFIPMKDRGG